MASSEADATGREQAEEFVALGAAARSLNLSREEASRETPRAWTTLPASGLRRRPEPLTAALEARRSRRRSARYRAARPSGLPQAAVMSDRHHGEGVGRRPTARRPECV
jgi:hypothetical protein